MLGGFGGEVRIEREWSYASTEPVRDDKALGGELIVDDRDGVAGDGEVFCEGAGGGEPGTGGQASFEDRVLEPGEELFLERGAAAGPDGEGAIEQCGDVFWRVIVDSGVAFRGGSHGDGQKREWEACRRNR